jgi:hypothetical protein
MKKDQTVTNLAKLIAAINKSKEASMLFREYTRLNKKYGADHPKVKKLNKEIGKLLKDSLILSYPFNK